MNYISLEITNPFHGKDSKQSRRTETALTSLTIYFQIVGKNIKVGLEMSWEDLTSRSQQLRFAQNSLSQKKADICTLTRIEPSPILKLLGYKVFLTSIN